MAKHGVRVDLSVHAEGVDVTVQIYGATYSPDVLDDACRRAADLVRSTGLVDDEDASAVDAVCAAEDRFAEIRANYDRTAG